MMAMPTVCRDCGLVSFDPTRRTPDRERCRCGPKTKKPKEPMSSPGLIPKLDYRKFVQRVREITDCDHEKAFEILGIVLEYTRSAYIQGVQSVYNQSSTKG